MVDYILQHRKHIVEIKQFGPNNVKDIGDVNVVFPNDACKVNGII